LSQVRRRSRRHRGKKVWYQVNPAFERFGKKTAGKAFQRWTGRPALEIRHCGWKLAVKQTTFR
jgi:hypothetical protein